MIKMKTGENLVGVDFRHYVIREHEIGIVARALKSPDVNKVFLFFSGVLFTLAFWGG